MESSKIKMRDNSGLLLQNSSLVFNYDMINKVTELLESGKVDDALNVLNNLKNSISGHHSLYPYYSIGIKNDKGKLFFVSEPNSEEAIKKYPPRYEGKMMIPKKYIRFSSINELLYYSYRNQEDIEINMKEFKKFLGDIVDPYQDKIFSPENLSKMKWKIKHKEFPPARPYKIEFNKGDFSLDYVLLRVKNITDDDNIVLSNLEQKHNLNLEIIADIKNNKCDFNIKISEKFKKDVYSKLLFINFMIEGKKKTEVLIISLEDNEIFMSGTLDSINYNSEFGSVEKEKEFLENLKTIEDFYDLKFELPDKVFIDDIEKAGTLAEAIKNKKVLGEWDVLNFEHTITKKSKDKILELEDNSFEIKYEMIKCKENIFGQSFDIPKIVRKFENVKIANIHKVKRKLEVLEEGDVLKIKCVPLKKEKDKYMDEFYFK